MTQTKGKSIPCDYDVNPERFRANVKSFEKYSLVGDVHDDVASWVAKHNFSPILDIGCGEGRLVHPIQRQNLSIVALDRSPTMLQANSAPSVLADANSLPFPNKHFRAVAALYMLYHLPEPRNALLESKRVLQPGGVFIACAPSRYNDPELSSVLPQSSMTFDAENGPEMIEDYFEIIEIERWDAPLVHLPDKAALTQYLGGRKVTKGDIQKAAKTIMLPLSLTKRGVLIYARKL